MNRAFQFACLLWMCSSALADDLVKVDPEKVEHLGIRTVQPTRIDSLPLARAPGRIVVPPQHEFLVSAPQSGLISKVNVALGSNVRAGQILAELRSPNWVGQ